MPARKLPFSTTFSTVYGTILGLVSAFYLILSREMASTHLTETDKVWISFAVVYAAVLPLSGLLYAAKEWPTVGIIHAVLMIGIAGPPFFWGLPILFDHATYDHDSPVAGIVFFTALAVDLAGVLALVCGVAMIRHLFSSKR
jgi:hypothetical protein